jgi:RHS repeat-associated protein
VITDAAGNIKADIDYYPFGGELDLVNNDSDHYKFTDKERDSETGLDYFGARYYSNLFSRFLTPDPLMASARAPDPQTWNRYAYARNNPLRFFDPTGLEEETAQQCRQDSKCTFVSLNVIYDKKANDGEGLTDKQKAAFASQLQEAKDEYGEAHIHFEVTYSTEYDKAAVNVVVSDNAGGEAGASRITGNGYAISTVDMTKADKETLSHELAHHFTGDTTGVADAIMRRDPTGLLGIIPNAVADVSNDAARSALKSPYPRGDPSSIRQIAHDSQTEGFTRGAKEFQQMLNRNAMPQMLNQPQKK